MKPHSEGVERKCLDSKFEIHPARKVEEVEVGMRVEGWISLIESVEGKDPGLEGQLFALEPRDLQGKGSENAP